MRSSLCVVSQPFERTFEDGFKCVRIHDAVKGGGYLPYCGRKSSKGENKAAMIVFTSGTMGTQKAVMLSQENIIAVIRGGNGYVVSEGETFSMLPLCHTYAFICGVLGQAPTDGSGHPFGTDVDGNRWPLHPRGRQTFASKRCYEGC